MFFPNKAVCPCAHADTTAPELVGTRRESELALELAKALGVLNLLPPTNSTTGAAHAKKKRLWPMQETFLERAPAELAQQCPVWSLLA